MTIAVATWNAEWATAGSNCGTRVSAILENARADVLVVTEGVRELLPSGGSVVDAGGDWGYGLQPRRRKVLVWSRFPLACDMVGMGGAVRGRLVVNTVQAPDGPMRVIGVCIPWRDAHVSTGRCDARPWSEHLEYLDGLNELLAGLDDGVPTVIAGDLNQRIPRGRQPVKVAERLAEVLSDWTVHTAGSLPNGPHIDHIATDRRLVIQSVSDWPAADQRGRLSDHAGVACRFGYARDLPVGPDQSSPSNSRPDAQWLEPPAEPRPTQTNELTPPASESALTNELRSEIEDVLRRSGDGLSHGATFRLREQGLSDEQIAAKRGVSLASTRGFLRSVDALLSGSLPETKSAARINSYVYRELLNHLRSDALDSHVKAQLQKLHEINSEVAFTPLQTRRHQYRVGTRKKADPVKDPCPECAAVGVIHSGRC